MGWFRMFHMSPSQGSLLHESVARSRELGRSIGRPVARSLGIRWRMREGRRGGKGGGSGGLREKKRKTQGRPTRIERGVLIVKKRFLSEPDTIKANMDKIRGGGCDYESGGGFDCSLIVLIRFISFACGREAS